jgi:hypothetical protein
MGGFIKEMISPVKGIKSDNNLRKKVNWALKRVNRSLLTTPNTFAISYLIDNEKMET